MGVHRAASGGYWAKFNKRYLGRFGTAVEAAVAHSKAAVAHAKAMAAPYAPPGAPAPDAPALAPAAAMEESDDDEAMLSCREAMPPEDGVMATNEPLSEQAMATDKPAITEAEGYTLRLSAVNQTGYKGVVYTKNGGRYKATYQEHYIYRARAVFLLLLLLRG